MKGKRKDKRETGKVERKGRRRRGGEGERAVGDFIII